MNEVKKLLDTIMIQQSLYMKEYGIELPELHKKVLAETSNEELCEAEIAYINAKYEIEKTEVGK